MIFATRIETDSHLMARIPGIFVVADGPWVADNIVSAAAMSLLPAKAILSKTGI